MCDKFDWNLDSPDFQRYLNMELNDDAADGGDQEPAGAAAPANAAQPPNRAEVANPAQAANRAEAGNPAVAANAAGAANPGDGILDPADAAEDPEFYMNAGMDGNCLPNDEIWKKFDLYEGLTNRGPEDLMTDSYDDMPWVNHMAPPLRNEAREIRNHDCMWAGHCISEKHDSNSSRFSCFPPTPPGFPRNDDPDLMVLTTPDGPAFADRPSTRRNAVVAPTHARSVLLPSRVVSSATTSRRPANARSHTVTTSFRVQRSRTLDSGGDSPRPETPQSLTDNEDLNLDLADMKAVEDLVADSFGYNFISDIVQNLGNEASGYDFGASSFDRNQLGSSSNAPSSTAPTRGANNRGRRNVVRQEVPVARRYTDHSFFSDHSYHLSKNARMDNLGVQTPSDSGARKSASVRAAWFPATESAAGREESSSEEEIDVETVYGEMKKPNSRSSSSGAGLPTNPSFSDRQQIQLSVATAISKKEVRRGNGRGGAAAQARNSAAAQARNSAAAQARNSAAAQARNSAAAQARNSAAAQARNSAAAQARNSAAAQARNSAAAQARNSAAAQARNSGAAQARNSGAAQGRNSGAAQARNSGAAQARAAGQASTSAADDQTVTGRVVTGVKRKYNARGETRRNAGDNANPDPEETEEAQNSGGKKRRCQNDNPPKAPRGRARKTGRNPGSSDSEVDSIEKRSIHNSMERQRRVDLRNSFEELRKLIPKTAANEKAAKVLILCSGADYCRALTNEENALADKKAELHRKQDLLLSRVSQLRRSLAARR